MMIFILILIFIVILFIISISKSNRNKNRINLVSSHNTINKTSKRTQKSIYQRRIEEYSKNNPFPETMEEVKLKTEDLQKENREWNKKFNENLRIFKKAKSLEKTDPYKAIELYESIKNTSYGNFATLDRLIILYRKTKQIQKELQNIDFNIEDLQNKEYNRMIFCIHKYPESESYIRKCYKDGSDCLMPNGSVINFKKKIFQLEKRKSKYNQ